MFSLDLQCVLCAAYETEYGIFVSSETLTVKIQIKYKLPDRWHVNDLIQTSYDCQFALSESPFILNGGYKTPTVVYLITACPSLLSATTILTLISFVDVEEKWAQQRVCRQVLAH